jgi:hypothetical protein
VSIVVSGLEGWAFLFLPYGLLLGGSLGVLLEATVAVVAVLLAVAGYHRLQRGADDGQGRWRHQALAATVASVVGLVPWPWLGSGLWS